MGILRHIVGIASELFTLPDPYDALERVTPRITGTRRDGCNQVIEVTANNYREVEQIAGDVNFPGMTVHTRVGHNKWEIRQEKP